jgi:hypothetical protein
METPMPPAMQSHEREQFRLYDAMRLVPLRRQGVVLTTLAGPSDEHGIRASGFMAQPLDLFFDSSHRLVGLRAFVLDPQTGERVEERLRFTGRIVSAGVAWPQRIAITWAGAPYFDLEITELKIAP